jgi:hypothetical protein
MRTISASMRQLLTQGGPFIGDNRASVRLTVEPDFWLTTTSGTVGNQPAAKLPIRWWQRADNSQTEVEIPNIQQVTITSDLSQQAATLQVQIYNTSMDPNGVMGSLATQLGEPGFFSWTFGESTMYDEAQARWNQQPNSWANTLRENALIRVYAGYGGQTLTIPEAVSAGNLILKGVFLLDDPVIESNGILTLNGRDMAKLLIDQQTIPPVIPQAKYPLNYWGPFQSYQIVLDQQVLVYGPGKSEQITGFCTMPKQNDYGADGEGYRLFGTDGGVFDYGSAGFYGSMVPTRLNGPITGGDVMPDGNGYRMCGSDGGVFDFGSAAFYGSGFHEVDMPIVSMRNTPTGAGYYLVAADGAVYAWGDATYRGGLNGRYLAAPIVDMAVTQTGGGYWLFAADGGIFTFGDAGFFGRPSTAIDGKFVSMDSTSTDKGYWCVTDDGAVFAFGDAQYYGGANVRPLPNGWTGPLAGPIVRLRKKEPFNGPDTGYWLCGNDGGVFSYGNLGFHGSLPAAFEYPVYAQPDYTDYCLDEQSEALTRRGWLRWDQIESGDEVLGIDPRTGKGAWHPVEDVYRRHRTNWEMIRFKGASFDALTTPDHRWLVRFGETGRYRWTTSDAIRTSDQIPLVVPPDHLPSEAKWDDDFVRLVAWFWTEGSWHSYGGQLSQSRRVNPQNTHEITETLRRLYGEPGPMGRFGKHRWRISERADGQRLFCLSSGVAKELRQVMNERKAVTPEFLLSLTGPQLTEYIDISLRADGCCRADGCRSLSQREESRIKSFEFACALAGMSCVVHQRSMAGRPAWTASLVKQDYIAPVRSATQNGRATVTKERYTGMVWCPQTGLGNFVARRNGSVYLTGNCDIIKDLALWAGFWLYDPTITGGQEPEVYGIIETTGAYDTLGPLGIEFFDKRPVIDVMTDIANLVGYVVRCDDVGSLRFQAPNIWQIGNFYDETGEYTNLIPQIDERISLSDYQMTQTDQELRSPIVVAVSDPYLWGGPIPGTNVTTFVPPYTPLLKGITKSAMFAVPLQVDAQDQAYFAELIALRIWLASRTGSVTAWCDPSICVGDQVQIFERQTGEVNVHYVKALTTTFDSQTGKFEMQLTTNWLGSTGQWAITSNLVGISEVMGGTAIPTTVSVPNTAGDPSTFTMTNALAQMLGASGSAATSIFAQAGGASMLGAQ